MACDCQRSRTWGSHRIFQGPCTLIPDACPGRGCVIGRLPAASPYLLGRKSADNQNMGRLSTIEVDALLEALDDEYKAWATYDGVIRDFGSIRPFINIRDAEGRHIDALLGVFHRYELTPPGNVWAGKAPHFDSVRSACAAAVQGEIENAALYERLLQSTDRPDILGVYRNLMDASQQRHLPAFQRCLNRGQSSARRE
jgi:hypothetical protein